VRSWQTEAELDGQRVACLSASPPLAISPPLRLLLATGADRDCLILNAHHAVLDGLSCLNLFRAVAARYSEALGYQPDGGGPDGGGPDGGGSGGGRLDGGRLDGSAPDHGGPDRGWPSGGWQDLGRPDCLPSAVARTRSGRIARIARRPDLGGPDLGGLEPAGLEPAGLEPAAGYGACLVSWGGLQTAAGRLRAYGSSVNDLLIAVMMITIRQWNDANDCRTGRIRITMPVGDRVAKSADGALGHLSRLTAVTLPVPAGARAGDLIGMVTRQTAHAKEHKGPQVDLPSRLLAGLPVPVAARQGLLRAGLRLAGPWLCDTSLVSNLGVIGQLRFGPAVATDVWFSTSAHLPRGLSLGVLTVAGRLHLAFRYQRGLFGDAAAAEFARRYVTVLEDFSSSRAHR
jgi:hypothetical protein